MNAKSIVRWGYHKARNTYHLLSMPYYHVTNPVKYNTFKNELERNCGSTKLRSYPTYVGINISTMCNQVCLFCCHDNKRIKHKNWIKPKLFKQMKWLRYVERIDLFCGTGDPLVNPHFPDVLRTVRKIAPYSTIGIFTNGLALEGENLDACLECLDVLHISLNAVTKEVYNSIIIGDYNRTMRNVKELSKRKPSRLRVELSMVLLRKNTVDVKPIIRLASGFGFDCVILSYFAVMTNRSDRFGKIESIKVNKSLLFLYEEYAKMLGVEFHFPQSNQPPTKCYQPWTHAYLTNDWKGEIRFQTCCSGFPMNLYISRDCFVNFRKVWNSKEMQQLRKTVNLPLHKQNTICFLCRQIDKLKPDWKQQAKLLAEQSNRKLTFDEAGFPQALEPRHIK